MRTKVFSLVVLFLQGSVTVFAGKKSEKLKVKGNSGMCESRIENAALSFDGVESAGWDKKPGTVGSFR